MLVASSVGPVELESSVMACMPNVVRSRFATAVTAALSFATAALCPTDATAAEPWPSQVHASYRIEFNSFDIGTFDFQSQVAGNGYTLTGDAKLSALLGAFKWQGVTRTSGLLAGDAPKPAGYTFDFNGAGKSGSVKMGFNGDAVTNLTYVPLREPAPGTIPVREAHLKSVLDPLSAVMALSRSENANPCGRRLAIFDGKQRFDLVLTYKRQERISEQRPSGQPGVAYVCKVRYMPIAGHKASEETRSISQSNDIEVSFRPVPSANLFVPHEISIPTGAGTARLVARNVRIVTRNEQIALGH